MFGKFYKYKMGFENQVKQLDQEERLNVYTHAFGFICTLLCTPIILSSESGNVQFIGLAIFSIGLLTMYFCSTTYHLCIDPKRKYRWRIMDHISIFLVIGCSYTPFIYFYLNNEKGIHFLSLQWILIAAGIIFKLIFKERYEIVSVSLYLFLGWRVSFIYYDITSQMNNTVLFFLIIGGFSYTLGVIFYIWEGLKYNHGIWHICVLIASACHGIALCRS